MGNRVEEIYNKIKKLEEELEEELEQAAEKFLYTVEKRKIRFEKSVAEYHRRLKKNWFLFILDANFLNILTAPVIYSMVLPLILIDLAATVYQLVCFPIYGIKKVLRSDFIVFDRHHLSYLNIFERLNCAYCGYANGLIAYLREIAGRTEKYWCPIKHARKLGFPHPYYGEFLEYGDAKGYQEAIKKLRGR